MSDAALEQLSPWLAPLGIDTLLHPERLPWLALALAAALALALRRPAPALPWPSLVEASVAGARRFEIVPLFSLLLRGGVLAFEADVRFAYRVLMDLGIRGGVEIDGVVERTRQGHLRWKNPSLSPAEVRSPLRLLSLDLETAPDASQIFSAAIATNDVEEVHLVRADPVSGAIVYRDERLLLEGAMARIREIDPDCLVGWNVVDFDLRVLDRRCQALGIPCRLGRDGSTVRFQQDRGFGVGAPPIA